MEPGKQLDNEKLVDLTRVYNEVEAHMIENILGEAGIDCLLVSQVPHSVYPFTINGLGETRIKVLETQLAKAQQVLQESGQFKVDENMESGEEPQE